MKPLYYLHNNGDPISVIDYTRKTYDHLVSRGQQVGMALAGVDSPNENDQVDGESSLAYFTEWVEKLEDSTNQRTVAQEEVSPGVWVSTSFLGVNLAALIDEVACYETRVFGGVLDGHFAISRTVEQAEEKHSYVVTSVRKSEGLDVIDELVKKRKNASWAF